jgi:hypothetical protein
MFFAPVQKTPAQKRKFLYLDAESPRQSEIRPHSATGAHAVVSDTFKGEYAASQIVSETGEYKLHLCAPSKT